MTDVTKGYWSYMCDEGHSWEVYRELDGPERPEDTRCPDGHEAVTLSKCPAVGEFQIVFRPAGRVVDRVKGQVWGEELVYIDLAAMTGQAIKLGATPLTWQAAIELATKLNSVSLRLATTLLDRQLRQ